ncbi:MAG: hypothetical protein HUU02_05690 [Bacteroidetes bacterium]|nr:hypothetical protein [Bacteroidota bacterium]
MNDPLLLLRRLDAIGASLRDSGQARALLALGSVGSETERLDEYSDLDFFVIAAPGRKQQLIDDLSWLRSVSPVAYHFKNTKDGHKLLFEDGIYCEFAVFEEEEMKSAAFSAGRIVWMTEDFDASLCTPRVPSAPFRPDDLSWAVGEMVTCIYVGLCRYARGERLSGTRFIQSFAADMMIACAPHFEQEQPGAKDRYQNERRFEQRFPGMAAWLPRIIQGYDRVPESALELLAMIEQYAHVDPSMKRRIIEEAERLIRSR